jgi:hypothetical protein
MSAYGQPMQLALLDDPIDIAFNEFHHANPQVYRQLVTMSRAWKDKGNQKCSMDMLFHVLRWEYNIKTTGEGFKLNDHYTSRYARNIAANNPDLADLFVTRTIKSDWRANL